jgi:hypothetical protein
MPETTSAGPCEELTKALEKCLAENGEGGCEAITKQLQECTAANQ